MFRRKRTYTCTVCKGNYSRRAVNYGRLVCPYCANPQGKQTDRIKNKGYRVERAA